MGLFVNPPFALFSLVDLPLETLNSILQQAHDGSTVDQWWFYLPISTDYSAALQKKPEGGGQEATKAPLPSSFKHAFVGKSAADVATWLKNKPDGVDLDGKFFGVLDKKAAGGKDGSENGEGNKVVLCRIGDRQGRGDKVRCVLMSAEESTLTLGGMEYGNFDELLDGKGDYVPDI